MGHEWIIDVIADLRRYADTHKLALLSAQLESASNIAKVEIDQVVENAFLVNQGENSGTQQLFTGVGPSGSA